VQVERLEATDHFHLFDITKDTRRIEWEGEEKIDMIDT
jgi:hypothetical protein